MVGADFPSRWDRCTALIFLLKNNQKTFYAVGKPLMFNKKKQKMERNAAYKKIFGLSSQKKSYEHAKKCFKNMLLQWKIQQLILMLMKLLASWPKSFYQEEYLIIDLLIVLKNMSIKRVKQGEP